MKIKLTNPNDSVVIEKSNGTSSEVATKADISALTKSDIGLGNVGNFKAVSTEAEQGLTDAEKANARNNIGVPALIGDDAARANWGGDWRMPTTDEISTLSNAVNTAWATDYQSSGIAGKICTDKTDSSKVLFFPAAGRCDNGSVSTVGTYCHYQSSSLAIYNKTCAYGMYLEDGHENWIFVTYRYLGYPVRPILDGVNANGHEYVEIGGLKWATMNIGANSVTDYGLYFQWGDTQGYTASQVGSGTGQKYFGWADYKYGNDTGYLEETDMTKYNPTDGLTTLELPTPVEYLHKVAVTGDYNDLSSRPTSLPANGGNANTVGNCFPGFNNGNVLKLVSWPSHVEFNSAGYYSGTDSEDYFKSACKWAIDSYPYSGRLTLIGSGTPNATGTLILHLYSESGKSDTTGLPRYCSGQFEDLCGIIITFGTNDYTWYSNVIATTSNIPSSLPASDVYSWAKASTKPSYTASEVGIWSTVSPITFNISSICSITGSSNAGKSQTIIYTNSTSSDLTVTVPTTYKTPDGAAIELTCKAGGYCEVNYLNIGGTIYARGL